MSAAPSDLPTPGQVSNRRLIERLQVWGVTVAKTKGDWTTLNLPSGATHNVRSPQCHKGNSSGRIKALMDALGLSWADFIGLPIDHPMTREDVRRFRQQDDLTLKEFMFMVQVAGDRAKSAERQADEQQRQDDRRKALARLDEEERQRAEEHTRREEEQMAKKKDDEAAAQQPSDARAPTGMAARHRGAASRVFEFLSSHPGEAFTTAQLEEAIGLPRHTVHSAGHYLVRQLGLAERVGAGIYRLAPNATTTNGDRPKPVDEQTLQQADAKVDAGEALENPPPKPSQPVAGSDTTGKADVLSPEDVEATVREVLDLLLPQGGFKAQHLDAIIAWREATYRLLRECRE